MFVDFCDFFNLPATQKSRPSMTLDRFQSLWPGVLIHVHLLVPPCQCFFGVFPSTLISVRVSFKVNVESHVFHSGGQLGQTNLSHFSLSTVTYLQSWFIARGVWILPYLFLPMPASVLFALTQSLRWDICTTTVRIHVFSIFYSQLMIQWLCLRSTKVGLAFCHTIHRA